MRPLRREEGFALLIVLWTMALLALLAAQVTGIGRAETRLAAAQRVGAQLEAAADAAVYETVWHMLPGSGDYWMPGAMERDLRESGGLVHVSITDERGKIDLNQAPPPLWQGLFSVLGLDAKTAQTLANAINDWHNEGPGTDASENVPPEYKSEGYAWGPPGQDFESLPELLLVRGMTPAIYQAILPYITLDLEQGPWPQYAPPIVLAAIDKAKRDYGLNFDQPDARGRSCSA